MNLVSWVGEGGGGGGGGGGKQQVMRVMVRSRLHVPGEGV